MISPSRKTADRALSVEGFMPRLYDNLSILCYKCLGFR